ncbi:unnamed protein product [Rotaria sp. Silwood2]|nr:unnamed protein product [Rotaria sp. Silwood2]CAF3494649.1 unnamed protein product [Rotaria sp. Silwood2]CAF4624010.1 unnamed protein product [Rotaria sp. Silwood2]
MTEPLLLTPQNIHDLQCANFFAYVSRYCSEDIVKYFELIRAQDYLELTDIKIKLTFNRPDGTCIIKLGIQHDINKLFESLQNTLANNEQVTTAATVKEDLVLSSEVIEKYPFLKRLVHFFIKLSQNVNPTDEPFLHHFLENLLSNISLAKSRYRYSEYIIDFALCLSILAGRNACEFIRLNIPGALPNLTINQTKIAKEGFCTVEGEFRYDDMNKYLRTINSTFVYCAENCTSAVREIVYDVQSNAFAGFTSPLDEHGMPRIQHFQTNSFEGLKTWFEQKDISHLINLHMIQPICISDKKKLLLLHLLHMELMENLLILMLFVVGLKCLKKVYTDVFVFWDTQWLLIQGYLLPMKLVCGFFGTLLNSPTIEHSSLFKVAMPVSWSWFYLPGEQLFLCTQDALTSVQTS